MDRNPERIRTLNDELRRSLPNCHAVIVGGVAALGPEAVARIVKTVAVYDDFCHANDPYEEHDFGSFEADGAAIFFKIDYFDKALTAHSPDPSDPSVTERVITDTGSQKDGHGLRMRSYSGNPGRSRGISLLMVVSSRARGGAERGVESGPRFGAGGGRFSVLGNGRGAKGFSFADTGSQKERVRAPVLLSAWW
jgi:Protein of unknown function (DUF3768)